MPRVPTQDVSSHQPPQAASTGESLHRLSVPRIYYWWLVLVIASAPDYSGSRCPSSLRRSIIVFRNT